MNLSTLEAIFTLAVLCGVGAALTWLAATVLGWSAHGRCARQEGRMMKVELVTADEARRASKKALFTQRQTHLEPVDPMEAIRRAAAELERALNESGIKGLRVQVVNPIRHEYTALFSGERKVSWLGIFAITVEAQSTTERIYP